MDLRGVGALDGGSGALTADTMRAELSTSRALGHAALHTERLEV